MITMIPREKLEPHPDNPRKELGDLSELAASIRRQGLLQNLTVVPHPDTPGKYRIVIGHRRFSASGIAGLDELPCAIDENMTYAEQLAVMMSENMQRNDLTVAEKVGGVQMMMDLGMTAVQVSEGTGISESSVRRYAKLVNLDRSMMRKAEQRGATLMQLAEASAIEDADFRRRALDAAGTGDFGRVLYQAKADAARRRVMPQMLEVLAAFAEKAKQLTAWATQYQATFWPDQKDALEDLKAFRPVKGAKYQYVISGAGTSITLYRIVEQREEDRKAAEKRAAQERIRARVEKERQAAVGFGQMRLDWLKTAASTRGRENAAMRFVLWAFTRTEYLGTIRIGGAYEYAFVPECSRETNTLGTIVLDREHIDGLAPGELLYGLVCAAFDRISQNAVTLLDSYTGKPKENAIVRDLYHFLEDVGYPVSSDERAWLDGTHECFGEETDHE